MDLLGVEIGEILTRQLVYSVVIFFIGVILLHIATSILNFEKRSLGKAAIVLILGSIAAFFLGFIPYIGGLLGLIFFWYLIKKTYEVGWFKSILAWFMSIFIAFIIALIILMILGISILFIPLL